jgi:hypothetical protein
MPKTPETERRTALAPGPGLNGAAIAGRIGTGMMVMGYLSAIVRDKEGAAECKAGAAGGGYHSACLNAYGALAHCLPIHPQKQ